MLRDPIILPEAEQDLDESFQWYQKKSEGLGYEFLSCVETSYLAMRRNPKMYPRVYKDYRRALVRRFPYAIFYECDFDQIVVYSVFHCSQNPKKWRKRLH